jgi:secondary thiamine-phosphate synthase enzyme
LISQIRIVNIQSLHTTATIIINENEPLLIEDMKKNFKEIAKKDIYYGHNDFGVRTVNMCNDECKNGHSHCIAAYMPTNVTLNIVKGKIQLGKWQKIFLIELDHDRPRKVNIQIMGA